MITRSILKFCFDSLTLEQVKELDKKEDFLLFELHAFNTGGVSTLKCMDWSEEAQEDAEDNGNLFIDKDDFLRLFEESGSTNEFLKEYL
jgi:uncharacterized protein (DUF1015 family)